MQKYYAYLDMRPLKDPHLKLISVLDEGHVPALDQTCLLEAWVLSEEHREHQFVHLCWQILHEEHAGGLAISLNRMRRHLRRGLGCRGRRLGPLHLLFRGLQLGARLPRAILMGDNI